MAGGRRAPLMFTRSQRPGLSGYEQNFIRSEEDTTAFEACTTLREAGNPMWKDMVKGTNWFQTCKSKWPSSCCAPLSRPFCCRQIAVA